MIIQIKVHPKSNKQEIKKQGEDYVVYLKSQPENNKANLELVKLLKKHFLANEIKIKSGKTSRKKVVEVL